MLSITIDWIAINFKELTHEAEHFMFAYARFDPMENVSPRFGYSIATMDNNGSVAQWNPDRADMGYHVIISGSALRNIFSKTSIQPHELLRAVVDAGGRISRLDLAKDLAGEKVDMQSIYQPIERGMHSGTARKYGRITSDNGGDTIYIGSRTSERFIRLYDKRAQQGGNGDNWYRMELETKGMVARALLLALVNTHHWEAIFDNMVRNMVWIEDNPSWLRFFANDGITIGLPKIEKQTDREAWIASQVIAAVARHYIDNPNSEAVARLIATLQLIERQRKD